MLESIGNRLRSRKLVQWTIAYLAAGFALLQLADFLKDAFDWPTAVLRVLTVVVAFGFLAALVLAWYHGEKGHQHVATTEVALLTVITAATFAGSWYVAVTTPPEADRVVELSPNDDARFAANDDPAAAPASIAVLPFVNMTPNEQNDYLTDGITEDIITELGKVQGLRVISRTSVMRYKQSDKNIREIAGELGVSTVLEGSVRVQGNQVRIVAQLIDAATDTHIWAETYDRDLKDILAVQSEVSRAIAGALNARLLPSSLASAPEVPTVDPDAYRLYLKGKSLANSTSDEERAMAAELFDSAFAKDPDLAQAWTARVGLQLPENLESTAMPELPVAPPAGPGADEAAKTAALAAGAAGARTSVNLIRAIRTRDLEGAEKAAKEAVEANPNSVPDRIRYAQILYARGRSDEAVREMQKAAANDPMSPMVHAQVGEYMMESGRGREAETHLLKAVRLDSTSARAHLALGSFYSDQGRLDEAIRELEAARRIEPSDPAILGALGYALARAGQGDAARKLADELEHAGAAMQGVHTVIAQVYAGLGDTDQAAEWLKKDVSAEGRNWSWIFASPRVRHQMEQLRKVPELAHLMDSLNIRIQMRRAPGDSVRGGPTQPDSRSRSEGRR